MESRRLVSLDALRGFDMLFIIGLERVIYALAAQLPEGAGSAVRRQMGHVAWEGLALYDLIFPLFVFISGVAVSLSLARHAEQGTPRSRLAVRLWVRAAVLAALGVLVNFELRWGLDGQRYASVLGLIGISGALAGSLALALRSWQGRALAAAALLAGVGALQLWGGSWMPAGCVNARIDALLCPGRLHMGVLDPEGPLCIVSAAGLCLLGMLAGELLRRLPGSRARRAAALAGAGAALLLLSLICGPVIKSMWTVAFVLAAAGISSLLLAGFHLLFDGGKLPALSWALRVVGANALFIYLLTHLGRFDTLTAFLFCWLPGADTPLGHALCYLALCWLICACMWQRKIFVKA